MNENEYWEGKREKGKQKGKQELKQQGFPNNKLIPICHSKFDGDIRC